MRLGDGEFVPIREVRRFAGDCSHVPGAIVLSVDGVEVLSLDHWDDINWLWPYVVQALDDCRRTGTGERYFPDQPILFRAKTVGIRGEVLLSVTGESLTRKVVAPAHELFPAVAQAGLEGVWSWSARTSSRDGWTMLERTYGTRPDLLPRAMVQVVRAGGPGERRLSWSGRAGVELLELSEHLSYERDSLGRFPRRSDGAIEWDRVDQDLVLYSADRAVLQDVIQQRFSDSGSLVFLMDSLAIPTVRMEFEQAVLHVPGIVESIAELWIYSPRAQILLEHSFAGVVTVARIPAREG